MTLAAALAALARIDGRFPLVEGHVRVEAAIAPPLEVVRALRAHDAAIRALLAVMPPDHDEAPPSYSAARLLRVVLAATAIVARDGSRTP